MSTIKQQAERLKAGETVQFRPTGQSMSPKIKSGQLITVSPDVGVVEKGDIVICKVKGRYYCHLVTGVNGNRYKISNNHGFVNGWTGRDCIYGIVTSIDS